MILQIAKPLLYSCFTACQEHILSLFFLFYATFLYFLYFIFLFFMHPFLSICRFILILEYFSMFHYPPFASFDLVRQTLKRFDYLLILPAFFTLANQLAGYPYKIQTSLLQK